MYVIGDAGLLSLCVLSSLPLDSNFIVMVTGFSPHSLVLPLNTRLLCRGESSRWRVLSRAQVVELVSSEKGKRRPSMTSQTAIHPPRLPAILRLNEIEEDSSKAVENLQPLNSKSAERFVRKIDRIELQLCGEEYRRTGKTTL